jgi:hypothetical protein
MNMAQSSGVITYTNKLADYQSRPPEQEADEKTTAGTSKTRIPEESGSFTLSLGSARIATRR